VSVRSLATVAVGILALLSITAVGASWGGHFVLLYSAVVVVPVALGAGALGMWLARRRRLIVAWTGQGMASFAAAVVLYLLAAMVVYAAFFAFDYSSTTALKLAFWIAFAAHLLLTVTGTAVAAHRFRFSFPGAVLGAAIACALLALPTLGILSFLNSCNDYAYPFSSSSC